MGSIEGDVSAECYPAPELSSPNKNLIASPMSVNSAGSGLY